MEGGVTMISLDGMVDLHIHPAPSIQKRKFTAMEALKFAHEEKMAGIVLLDHTYNTTMVADTTNEMGFETEAYGTIMLNEAVGGVNASVVEIALALGTKQIQMPTYSSKGHQDAYGDDQKIFPYRKRAKPAYILDDKGRLIPEVEEILELVKSSDAFLGSGHLSPKEVDVLVKRVKELGLMFVANSVSTDMPGYPIEDQKKWAGDNVFMEHDYLATTDVPHQTTPIEVVLDQIRAVGAEKCVLGSDAGTIKLPNNVECMKGFISRLMEAGLTEQELDHIARRVPKILLGIS